MRIAAVGRALPPHYYDQDTLIEALRRRWGGRFFNPERLERLHRNLSVGGRHLALPLEDYEGLTTWGKANDAWIRVAQEVGAEAVRDALDRAGLAPRDLDAIFFVTVTGIATPSIDARLINRLGLSPTIKRTPIFGLGCVAGAAGLSRTADYIRGFPDHVALLLSVELCSLTLQEEDLSIPNLIASGLFGDGAAAAVLVGASRPGPGPYVVATRSVFYPDSERLLGWDISESGFKIVLSVDLPDVIHRSLRGDVDSFLADHGLTRADVSSWICHPGGPKILEATQEALDIPDAELAVTWDSLRRVGNLSSASVLVILAEILENHRPAPGSWGMLLAMGPGFCAELVLLQW